MFSISGNTYTGDFKIVYYFAGADEFAGPIYIPFAERKF